MNISSLSPSNTIVYILVAQVLLKIGRKREWETNLLESHDFPMQIAYSAEGRVQWFV
jgi:hypothetical protein